jgi:hypothetical protein
VHTRKHVGEKMLRRSLISHGVTGTGDGA